MIFLRPLFLLLLIVPFIFLYIRKRVGTQSAWSGVCDPKLLPYLIIDVDGEKRTKFYNIIMFVLWCIGSIALAGPALLKPDVPTNTLQSGIVAVVDMSPVTDNKALEQITHKLLDLAQSAQDANIGLVLADQKAYVALPLTQDKNILRNIVAQLKEKNIMPSVGQNIPAGIQRAETLLSQSHFTKGQILVFTSGVDKANEISKAVKTSKYDVFIIGVGNLEEKKPVLLNNGSFWNNGTLYGLSDAKKKLGTSFVLATLDDSDLKYIQKSQHFEKDKINETKVKQYQDIGVWLVVLMLPFVVLLFRKGVLFLFFMMLFTSNANAGFWQRSEQEDYQTQINAINDFNEKKYEEALKGFALFANEDVEALYNQGNTLAFMGKIDEAIKIYEKVLSQDPNHDDATFNLAYLKKAQEKQQQEQQQQQDQQQSSENMEKSDQGQEPSSENKSNEQQESESQSKESQKDEHSNKDKEDKNKSETQKEDEAKTKNKTENENDAKKEEQQTEVSQNEQTQEQKNQAEQPVSVANQKQKEWLDRINSDAGRVLRYRLRQQYGAQQ